jgi:hypothetical protein
VESRDELLVEDRHLAVEYEDIRPELRDRGGELGGGPSFKATMRQPSTFSS